MLFYICAILLVCVTTLVVVSLCHRRVSRRTPYRFSSRKENPSILEVCKEPNIPMKFCPRCGGSCKEPLRRCCEECDGMGFVECDDD